MKASALAVILLAFFTTTCSQDPIFYIIAKETAPKKPRIQGAPTNMVVFERNGTNIMCVASDRLYWYHNGWNSNNYNIPQPGGKIISLAVATTASNTQRLYALCIDYQSTNTMLRYIESDGTRWTSVPSIANYIIQSIYADPEKEQLFAGALARGSIGYNFTILYLDENDSMQPFTDENGILSTALLSGAVYRDNFFYLSTRGEIFQVNDDGFTDRKKLNGDRTMFMGMIKLEDDDETIIAVARYGGSLYEVNEDSIDLIANTLAPSRYATGALALWEDYLNPDRKMLVAGVQGEYFFTSSSYSHGYAEFDLTSSGSFNRDSPRREANSLQSVHDAERYTTSLGRHPVNHLFQSPPDIDPNMTFFASTQTAGLWSYRDRPENGGWQWNAEE